MTSRCCRPGPNSPYRIIPSSRLQDTDPIESFEGAGHDAQPSIRPSRRFPLPKNSPLLSTLHRRGLQGVLRAQASCGSRYPAGEGPLNVTAVMKHRAEGHLGFYEVVHSEVYNLMASTKWLIITPRRRRAAHGSVRPACQLGAGRTQLARAAPRRPGWCGSRPLGLRAESRLK